MGTFQKGLSRGALIKFLGLVVFSIGAVCLYRFTALKELMTPQTLDAVLEASGFWAPVVFMALEAAAITLFVPASILIILAAGLFGAYWGFLYAWIAAWLGAACALMFPGAHVVTGYPNTARPVAIRPWSQSIHR